MPFIASILHVYTATVVYSSSPTIQSKEETKPLRRIQETTGKDQELVACQASELIHSAHRPRMLNQLYFFKLLMKMLYTFSPPGTCDQ